MGNIMRGMAAAAATGLMMLASPAVAQAVNVTSVAFTPGSVNGAIHSSLYNGDTGIGRFEFKGTYAGGTTSFDFFTYCVDLAHYVQLGDVNYADYSIQSPAALGTMTTAKANALNALISNTNPLLAAATGQGAINIAAATQMAVWEIMFETQPTWSVTNASSSFYATTSASSSSTASAESLANGYLANIASNGWTANNNYQLTLLYSPTHQTQAFLTPSVPEPATWGMLILGFGAIGGALRRRRAPIAAIA